MQSSRRRLLLGALALVLLALGALASSALLLGGESPSEAPEAAAREVPAGRARYTDTLDATDGARDDGDAPPGPPAPPGPGAPPGPPEPGHEASQVDAEDDLPPVPDPEDVLDALERLGSLPRVVVPAGPAVIEVVGPAAEPVVGARVRLWPPRLVGARLLAELRTDAEGRATLPASLRGPIVVALVECPLGLRIVDVAVAHGAQVLLAAPRIGGRGPALLPTVVRVHGERERLPGATVRLIVDGLVLTEVLTDAAGEAKLPDPTGLGDALRLEVTADGWLPARRGDLPRGGARIDLLRGAPGAVTGRVTDGLGLAVSGALVRASVPDGTPAARAVTDDEGRFSLARLAPGRTTLEVWCASDVADATASAFVEAGRMATVDLVVAGRATIEVQVVDAQGPVANALVRAVDPVVTRYGRFDAGAAGGQRTDAGGRARLDVAPGGWHLRATSGDREATSSVQVAAGARARARLDLGATRDLRVRAVDPDGAPQAGVFMDVSMAGFAWRDMPSARTDADGVALFSGLPRGRAEVHVGDLRDQWRMVRTEGQEATIVLSPPVPVRLRVTFPDGSDHDQVALVTVLDDVAVLHARGHEGAPDESPLVLEIDADGDTVGALVSSPAPDGPAQAYLLVRDPSLAPHPLGPLRPLEDGGRGVEGEPEVRFARAATLRGRVTGEDGRPRAGVVRVLGPLGGALAARTQWLAGTANDRWVTVNEWSTGTGPDGAFELGGLPPGHVELLVEAIGSKPRTVAIEVTAGGTVDLGELRLERAD